MKKKLNDKLNLIKFEKGISLMNISESTGLSYPTVQRVFKTGETNIATLTNILDVLGYELDIKKKESVEDGN